ncbi:MAG: NUDIX domain-containing protein [Alphaproteobacteria bacterium]|nr:NUDIX domain-containing protein [Alphaproteobacteria bacterium]
MIRTGYRAAYFLRSLYWRAFSPITLGVRAAIFDTRGHVLLVRHSYRPGWYMPGGGVDRRETIRDALFREIWEEVGVVPQDEPQLVGVYTNLIEHKSDHVALYAVRQFTIQPQPNIEIAESGFFDPEALPGDVSPGTKRRLDEIAGRAPVAPIW